MYGADRAFQFRIERQRVAGEFPAQNVERLHVVDIVPARHIEHGPPDFTRALDREAIHVRRAPRHVVE